MLPYALLLLALVFGLQLSHYFFLVLRNNLEAYYLIVGLVFLFLGITVQRMYSVAQKTEPDPREIELSQAIISALNISELEVLKLALQGMSNQQIADCRDVSLNTIKTQLGTIYSKMGVQNKPELIAKFLQNHPLV